MDNEEKQRRVYKIEEGDIITVYRQDFNNNIYYKAMISKKNQDGTKERFYKELHFKKDVLLEDKTVIRIISMFEDVRKNPKDSYNPIYNLFIKDFEITERQDTVDAINEYKLNTVLNDENINIDDNFLD